MFDVRIRKKLLSAGGLIDLDVDLSFCTPGFTVITGPSGSGKTTLLRIISGLMRADEGVIVKNGVLLYDSSLRVSVLPQKRKIGFLFQDYTLFPNMTLLENILYGCSDRTLVNVMIERAGLESVRNLKPNKLSGGQRQRCALLRSVLNKPEVLLLDEPFSSLDEQSKEQLHDLVLSLYHDFQFTVIMVSHNHAEIFKLAERVIEINSGCVVRDKPKNEYYLTDKLTNKFSFSGTVLEMRKSGILYIAYISVGNSICQVAVSENDMHTYKPGKRVLVGSKAFNTIIKNESGGS